MIGSLDSFSGQVVDLSMTAFNRAAGITNIFVVPLTLIRIGYLNAVGGKSESYTGLFRGIVLYTVLIYSFGWLLQILITFPEYFFPHFGSGGEATVNPHGFRSAVANVIPNVLFYTLESLIAVLYYLASLLSFAITILMASMAPVIFLLGGVLEIGLGIETFFSLLVMVACWPIIFASCDAMREFLMPNGSSGVSGMAFELLTVFFKLVGPLAMARAALMSHAGQAMKTAASGLAGAGGHGVGQALSFKQGITGQDLNHQPRSLSGYAAQAAIKVTHSTGRQLSKMSAKPKEAASDAKTANAATPQASSARDLKGAGVVKTR